MCQKAEIVFLFFFQFYYPGTDVVQLRFLRLHSSTAVQSMTYSCPPGYRLGQTDRDVKFLTDTRMQSFLGVLKDCVVCKTGSMIMLELLVRRHYYWKWSPHSERTKYIKTQSNVIWLTGVFMNIYLQWVVWCNSLASFSSACFQVGFGPIIVGQKHWIDKL